MARPWTPEVELSPDQARGLIERAFPALRPVRVEPMGEGWDNSAFLVNGSLVFRFPRRQVASDLVLREARVLPLLAPHIRLSIPGPEFVAQASESFPFPFIGYPFLDGATACRTEWTDETRAANAAPLGSFLRELHGIPVSAETRSWAPGDEIFRADMVRRLEGVQQRIRALETLAPQIATPPLLVLVEKLARAPGRTEPPVWVHGDLYARHLLVDSAHALRGVIDWGDVHLGDTAIDLSIAFSFLPATAREEFRAAYGSIDAPTWDRARFRAIHYGAMLVEFGKGVADPALESAGIYALREAPSGPAG